MLVYKLTDASGRTRGPTQWGEGVEHLAPGGGPLCTDRWIHAYRDPWCGVFFDCLHGRFGADAWLWEADADVGVDDGTKVGCTRLRTLRRIPLPVLTPEQRVRIVILATRTVYQEPQWTLWADRWLSGEDRSGTAAWEAVGAAAWAAAWAAWAAAAAAWAAALAARAASTGALSTLNAAVLDAASAAELAMKTASAAELAMKAARTASQPLDLVAIVHQVVDGERVDDAPSEG